MALISSRAARARPAVWLSAGLAALSLSACATVPNLGPKPQARPAETYATAKSFDAPAADWPTDRWWDVYNDAQLSKLIDEALAGSPTLAQAQARLRAADAQAEQARGATLPSLKFNGQVDETEASRADQLPYPVQRNCCPKDLKTPAKSLSTALTISTCSARTARRSPPPCPTAKPPAPTRRRRD